ncbi:hypothetical protein [Pseudofulvimonas gallinarii]|uniref:Uncharacterized protein n=1 Tax=Pseudofulvimonas gallinarii TaxID=634155 RepID=A0A4R3LKN0_9GAMM|nr:hypothetical protein EDC25_10486 [Pseudofulvimonas gallinarii]
MRILFISAIGLFAACGNSQDDRLDDRAYGDTSRAAIEQAARDGRCAELQAPDSHECLRIAPTVRADAHPGGDGDAQRRMDPSAPRAGAQPVAPPQKGTGPQQDREQDDGR